MTVHSESCIMHHVPHRVRGESDRLGIVHAVYGSIPINKSKFADNSSSLLVIDEKIQNTIYQLHEHQNNAVIFHDIEVDNER